MKTKPGGWTLEDAAPMYAAWQRCWERMHPDIKPKDGTELYAIWMSMFELGWRESLDFTEQPNRI